MSKSKKQFKIEKNNIEKVQEYIYVGHQVTLSRPNQTAELSGRIRLRWRALNERYSIVVSSGLHLWNGDHDFNRKKCGNTKSNANDGGKIDAGNNPGTKNNK